MTNINNLSLKFVRGSMLSVHCYFMIYYSIFLRIWSEHLVAEIGFHNCIDLSEPQGGHSELGHSWHRSTVICHTDVHHWPWPRFRKNLAFLAWVTVVPRGQKMNMNIQKMNDEGSVRGRVVLGGKQEKKRLKWSQIKEPSEHLCGIALGIRRVSYILSALKI